MEETEEGWEAEEARLEALVLARRAARERAERLEEAEDAEIGSIIASVDAEPPGTHAESGQILQEDVAVHPSPGLSIEALAIARVMAMERARLEAEERAQQEEREWEEEERQLEAEERARKEERAARLAAENAVRATWFESERCPQAHIACAVGDPKG